MPRISNKNIMFASYAALAFCLIFIVLNVYGFYKKEYVDNPVIKEGIDSFDAGYIYDFYVASAPNIKGRGYYGSENTSITLIAFLDPESDSSRYFMEGIFPQLREEFINTSKVKFYNKNYITSQDLADRNSKFIHAFSLSCIKSIRKEDYYQLYFDLFKLANVEELQSLIEKYKIPKEEFNECIKRNDIKELLIDISEVENFGMLGITPRFYIGINGRDNTIIDGVPKYLKFKRTIKQYEVRLGE